MPGLCVVLPGAFTTPRGSRRRFCSLGVLGVFRGAEGVRRGGGCSLQCCKAGLSPHSPPRSASASVPVRSCRFFLCCECWCPPRSGYPGVVTPELGSCEVALLFLGAYQRGLITSACPYFCSTGWTLYCYYFSLLIGDSCTDCFTPCFRMSV